VFCRAKSNIGADGGGFAYTLRQSELASHPGIVASSVCWGDVLDGTARELLASVEVVVGNSGGWDGGGALDEAKEFLRDILADGARPSKEIRGEARDLMISEATLRRAKKALGIVNRKYEFNGKFSWERPDSDAPPNPSKLLKFPEVAHSKSVSDFDGNEQLRGEAASAAPRMKCIANCKSNENSDRPNDAAAEVET
jgi:putative DNA primase/helicase